MSADACELVSPNIMLHDALPGARAAVIAAQVVRFQAAHHAALLEHAHPVADRDRLVQLVGDEDDGQASGLEPEQDLLELRDALRA